MKNKDRKMLAGNLLIDQFLVKKDTVQTRKTQDRIIVPPSSGLPPAVIPTHNVLVLPTVLRNTPKILK